jgi:CHAD domain-containing protein
LLRSRIGAVFSHLPKALTGEEEAVHQFRVAGRRLRVALPLCATKPHGRRVRRARRRLQQVIRVGGGCRDLDVAVTLFDEAARAAGETPGTRLLRRRLRAARAGARRRMTARLLDQDIARLRADLRVTLARGGVENRVVMARVRDARDRLEAELVLSMRALGTTLDPVALHDHRRVVRRLRYIAEVGVDLGPARASAPKRLKELQEMLGDIHDRHVLGSWLDAQASRALQRGEPDLLTDARRLRDLLSRQTEERHQAYLASDPPAIVIRAMGEIAPLARRAGRPARSGRTTPEGSGPAGHRRSADGAEAGEAGAGGISRIAPDQGSGR